MGRKARVSAVLLADGVLLIVLGFMHLLSTQPIRQWLHRSLTPESLGSLSPADVVYHVTVGFLLIPFGVSTLYSAAGVRSGHIWARAIAFTNAAAVFFLPLVILWVMGSGYFSAPIFLVGAVAMTAIGLSMVLALVWLSGGKTGPGDANGHHPLQ